MKVLIFTVDNRKYAINIGCVPEAVSYQPVIATPKQGDFVEGLVDIRGKLYTCINLHKMLFNKQLETNEGKLFLLTEIDDKLLALLIDDVSTVYDITEEDIDKNVLTVAQSQERYLDGIFRYEDSLCGILNLSTLVERI